LISFPSALHSRPLNCSGTGSNMTSQAISTSRVSLHALQLLHESDLISLSFFRLITSPSSPTSYSTTSSTSLISIQTDNFVHSSAVPYQSVYSLSTSESFVTLSPRVNGGTFVYSTKPYNKIQASVVRSRNCSPTTLLEDSKSRKMRSNSLYSFVRSPMWSRLAST